MHTRKLQSTDSDFQINVPIDLLRDRGLIEQTDDGDWVLVDDDIWITIQYDDESGDAIYDLPDGTELEGDREALTAD